MFSNSGLRTKLCKNSRSIITDFKCGYRVFMFKSPSLHHSRKTKTKENKFNAYHEHEVRSPTQIWVIEYTIDNIIRQ